jgi:hypothetical protein
LPSEKRWRPLIRRYTSSSVPAPERLPVSTRTVIDVTGVLAWLGVGTDRIQVNGAYGAGKLNESALSMIVDVDGWPRRRTLA